MDSYAMSSDTMSATKTATTQPKPASFNGSLFFNKSGMNGNKKISFPPVSSSSTKPLTSLVPPSAAASRTMIPPPMHPPPEPGGDQSDFNDIDMDAVDQAGILQPTSNDPSAVSLPESIVRSARSAVTTASSAPKKPAPSKPSVPASSKSSGPSSSSSSASPWDMIEQVDKADKVKINMEMKADELPVTPTASQPNGDLREPIHVIEDLDGHNSPTPSQSPRKPKDTSSAKKTTSQKAKAVPKKRKLVKVIDDSAAESDGDGGDVHGSQSDEDHDRPTKEDQKFLASDDEEDDDEDTRADLAALHHQAMTSAADRPRQVREERYDSSDERTASDDDEEDDAEEEEDDATAKSKRAAGRSKSATKKQRTSVDSDTDDKVAKKTKKKKSAEKDIPTFAFTNKTFTISVPGAKACPEFILRDLDKAKIDDPERVDPEPDDDLSDIVLIKIQGAWTPFYICKRPVWFVASHEACTEGGLTMTGRKQLRFGSKTLVEEAGIVLQLNPATGGYALTDDKPLFREYMDYAAYDSGGTLRRKTAIATPAFSQGLHYRDLFRFSRGQTEEQYLQKLAEEIKRLKSTPIERRAVGVTVVKTAPMVDKIKAIISANNWSSKPIKTRFFKGCIPIVDPGLLPSLSEALQKEEAKSERKTASRPTPAPAPLPPPPGTSAADVMARNTDSITKSIQNRGKVIIKAPVNKPSALSNAVSAAALAVKAVKPVIPSGKREAKDVVVIRDTTHSSSSTPSVSLSQRIADPVQALQNFSANIAILETTHDLAPGHAKLVAQLRSMVDETRIQSFSQLAKFDTVVNRASSYSALFTPEKCNSFVSAILEAKPYPWFLFIKPTVLHDLEKEIANSAVIKPSQVIAIEIDQDDDANMFEEFGV